LDTAEPAPWLTHLAMPGIPCHYPSTGESNRRITMRRLLHLFSVFVMAGFTALAHAEIPAKVVLITGSASGIGKALAEQLLPAEHVVYGADIEVTGNGDLAELGGTPLVMDVTEDHQVRAGVDKIIREQGRIDVLVNNAGIGAIGPIEDLSD